MLNDNSPPLSSPLINSPYFPASDLATTVGSDAGTPPFTAVLTSTVNVLVGTVVFLVSWSQKL